MDSSCQKQEMEARELLTQAHRIIREDLKEERLKEVEATASRLASRGKGILAADESIGTLGKRLIKAGLRNEEATRRAYRQVLFSAPNLGESLSGAILNEETLFQHHSDGVTPLPEFLSRKGVLVGVKTDKGLEELSPSSPLETRTKGLEDLRERSAGYRAVGARFAKWRAVLRVEGGGAQPLPTRGAVVLNAAQLALYAAISQVEGLVPIVEPEILIDGSHSVELFAEVSERVLGAVFAALAEARVPLEGCLLKPQMMMAGTEAAVRHTQPQLVELTLRALRRRVPPALPGIVFLSGGQSEEEATRNLDALNRAAGAAPSLHPWTLSFSFGRSLQASVLEIWRRGGEEAEAEAEAIDMAGRLALVNAAAQRGEYQGPHPSILRDDAMLLDPNRGWQQPPPS
jgi:fructose-bisphosphate aldolase class I